MRYFSLTILALVCVSACFGGDWNHWRGPTFNGSTDEKGLPSKWSRTVNIAWSADLPGPSAATPIVNGDRVFITSADPEKNELIAMCLDRKSGKVLWQDVVGKGGINRDKRSNFAAPSAATDGKVVVFFFSTGYMGGYDFNGKKLWSRNIKDDYGTFAFLWTFSSSPTIYKGRLYLQVLQRDTAVSGRGFTDKKNRSYILAIDPKTGKTLWRQFRPSEAIVESREAFSTPIPAVINGKDQLLVVGGDDLTGHDLATGEELWRWGTWNPDRQPYWRIVPSPVMGKGIVLACGPKTAPIYAIKPKGSGKLGDDAIAWTSKDVSELTTDVPTAAFYDGDFFVLSDLRKRLMRVEATTGKVKWSIETPGKAKYEASPLAADGKIYIINHAGEAAVIDAATGSLISGVVMDDPKSREVVRASISASKSQLFIRTTRKLYCIGK